MLDKRPEPPENYSVCGTCGYSAPQSEYHHNPCPHETLFIGLLFMVISIPLLAFLLF